MDNLELLNQMENESVDLIYCDILYNTGKKFKDYDDSYRKMLKKAGMVTRDPRSKERKKPGLKAARRAPQFSKR